MRVSWIGLLLAVGVAVAAEDPRSQVLLGQDCGNEFTRRELTLFANGTLRLREGTGATRTMRLAELGPAELEAYVRRLEQIRFDDLAPTSPGLSGDWVEQCELVLDLPDLEPLRFTYGRYDSVALGLRHVLLVIDDLLGEIDRWGIGRDEAAKPRAVELDVGKVLIRRRDGARFEVLGFTLEGTGVELQGIDQPITLIMLKDDVQLEFDAAGEDSPP